MIRGATNMTRFGNGFNPVNETNDQVFLKSDGFEQSRYYQNNQSRYHGNNGQAAIQPY